MFSRIGEHILAERKQISLGICVSWVGEQMSLGICVSRVEICVSQIGEHISLGIAVSQYRETHITSYVFPG